MNNINYESTMLKYGVSDIFMSELASLMLENKGLDESLESLKKSHNCEDKDHKKLYVLASSIASSIMGEDLSVVCPNMHKERVEMKSLATASFKKRSASKMDEYETIELIMNELEEASFDLELLSLCG